MSPMTEEYKRYLASDQWRQTRLRALAYHGGWCAVCGKTRRLQVHHLRYYDESGRSILGHEKMSDFRILCKKHHPKGRYSDSAIRRDRTSLAYANALVRVSNWGLWLLLLPFRLGYRLLRLCLRRKRPAP